MISPPTSARTRGAPDAGSPPRRCRAALALAMAAVALAGCSGTVDSSASVVPAATSVVDPTEPGAVATSVTTRLTSEMVSLATVGPDATRVFGWNLLTGTGTFLDRPVEVRLQGNVEYVNGNGPFGGFVRLIAADGSEIAFNLDGQASAGEPTRLRGRLEFIGATGAFEQMVAVGSFAATRGPEVGAPIEATMDITVDTDGVG